MNCKYLFNSSTLQELDFTETSVMLKHKLSYSNPGERLNMRPLCNNDYGKGFMELLSQLTEIGNTSENMFINRFDQMQSCENCYYIVVIEDLELKKVIASGTLTLEKQLISDLQIRTRGRIEDIVVLNSHRGKYLGKLLLDTLTILAEYMSCEDLSLECKDPLVKFYNHFGFEVEQSQIYMGNRYL